jgi:hypothetical protein
LSLLSFATREQGSEGRNLFRVPTSSFPFLSFVDGIESSHYHTPLVQFMGRSGTESSKKVSIKKSNDENSGVNPIYTKFAIFQALIFLHILISPFSHSFANHAAPPPLELQMVLNNYIQGKMCVVLL